MLKEIKTESEHYFVDENDLKQGEYKRYWSNGQLRVHSFYKNNKLHGERKVYYGNSRLEEHSFFLNGNRHGEYKDYYSNGKLWEHIFYENGNRHGEYHGKFDTFFFNDTNIRINPLLISPQQKLTIMLSKREIPVYPIQKLFTNYTRLNLVYFHFKPFITKILIYIIHLLSIKNKIINKINMLTK